MGLLAWLAACVGAGEPPHTDPTPNPHRTHTGPTPVGSPAGDTRGSGVPEAAVRIVAEFEGFRERPYLCPARVPTIGFGTTRYPDGRAVTLRDRPITEVEALRFLAHDLAEAARAVDALVTVPLNEAERSSLVSFVFNVGRGAFAGSTLLRRLNEGRRDLCCDEFLRWVRARGRVLGGLRLRRIAESRLFAGRDWRNP